MATQSTEMVKEVVEQLLAGHQQGLLSDLMTQGLTAEEEALLAAWLRPILTVGGTWLATQPKAMAVTLLLQWAVIQSRPDKAETLLIEDDLIWLTLKQWRPFLALSCHYGFMVIPDFPKQYYRTAEEPVLDNLCGLWDIGNSTFYRYLDRGKQQMVQVLWAQWQNGRFTQALRLFTQQRVIAAYCWQTAAEQQAWHDQQMVHFQERGHYEGVIWHGKMAGNFAQLSTFINRHVTEIAATPAIIDDITAVLDKPMSVTEKVPLFLALAAVYRALDDNQAERRIYKQAIKVATKPLDEGNLALIYSHLGKYYEPRDEDRALTYYQNSIDLLNQVSVAMPKSTILQVQIRLAWLYTLRNDPRAGRLLEAIDETLLPLHSLTRAELEKSWGEYLRRKGTESDLQQSLTHTHQALLIYEALGETRGVISCYLNLGTICGALKQFEQALPYYEAVLTLAEETAVDGEILASTHLDLGVIYFYQKAYDRAIAAYELGLKICLEAKLQRHMGRAHYNLAEAYYMRFLHQGDTADEWQGDRHNLDAIDIFKAGNFEVELAYAKRLKRDLFQGVKKDVEQHILPREQALHVAEMMLIEQNRTLLEQEQTIMEQVKARLAIAHAYLVISVKERDEALALCDEHGLTAQFKNELTQMQQLFKQTQTEQEQMLRVWQEKATIPSDYIAPLLTQLFTTNKVTKRAYADLCEVSLATASKHLGQLAEVGLLQRQGQGRSTHYVLRPLMKSA